MTNETREVILKKFADWILLTKEQRITQGLPPTNKDFAIAHGVSYETLRVWKNNLERKATTPAEEEVNLFLAQLAADVTKQGAKSADRALYANIKGLTVDKKEIKNTVEFTPTDYNRISNEILLRLRDSFKERGGICPVCGRLQILLDQVCEDTKQEHSPDSEVATVSVPARPPEFV